MKIQGISQKSEFGMQKRRCMAVLIATITMWLTALTVPLHAQTNSALNEINGTVPQNFFQSVGGYFTSINTNYSFTSNVLEVATGAGQSGPVLADYVSAQWDAWDRWDAAAQVRNAGIAGVIQSAELGGGYSVIRAGDTKLQVGVFAGYDWNKSAVLFEPELVVRKKATRNTFFEAGVSLPLWTAGPMNKTPAFFVGTGFTY